MSHVDSVYEPMVKKLAEQLVSLEQMHMYLSARPKTSGPGALQPAAVKRQTASDLVGAVQYVSHAGWCVRVGGVRVL